MNTLPRARHENGLYRVPGGEGLLWVELDGRAVGVISSPAYLNTDGTLEPGLLRSWIATEIRYTRFFEGDERVMRVRPVICEACGDTGQGTDTDTCPACRGLGHERNARTCAWCEKIQYFPAPFLPVAPRETLNHELLLARMHPDCAIAATVAHVRATEPAMVGLEELFALRAEKLDMAADALEAVS